MQLFINQLRAQEAYIFLKYYFAALNCLFTSRGGMNIAKGSRNLRTRLGKVGIGKQTKPEKHPRNRRHVTLSNNRA
jgi:site-specific recombinase XerC